MANDLSRVPKNRDLKKLFGAQLMGLKKLPTRAVKIDNLRALVCNLRAWNGSTRRSERNGDCERTMEIAQWSGGKTLANA